MLSQKKSSNYSTCAVLKTQLKPINKERLNRYGLQVHSCGLAYLKVDYEFLPHNTKLFKF